MTKRKQNVGYKGERKAEVESHNEKKHKIQTLNLMLGRLNTVTIYNAIEGLNAIEIEDFLKLSKWVRIELENALKSGEITEEQFHTMSEKLEKIRIGLMGTEMEEGESQEK